MSASDDPRHGDHIEAVVLKGGRYDGVTVQWPHSVVSASLDDERYYRTNRRQDGQSEFTHASIWGRA